MPENDLLDLLVAKFGQYRFWTLHNLKAKLRQPEAYLKQTLEKIAKNVKVGDMANTWTLKTQEDGMDAELLALGTENAMRTAKDEVAPGALYGLDDDDDFGSGMDDDDNVEMEDVKL